MNKQQVEKAITELKKGPKRNFSQSYDLIINLRNLDLKKTDNHIAAHLRFLRIPLFGKFFL